MNNYIEKYLKIAFKDETSDCFCGYAFWGCRLFAYMQQRHYYKYTNILCNNQQLFVCIQGLQYLLLLLPCLFFLCVCMPFLCHVTQLNPWFWSYEEGCIVFTIRITIIYSILNGIEFYRKAIFILTVNQYIISKYASTS